MTTSQKAIISLLIAVLLFGGFAILTLSELFDLPEISFYNPPATEEIFPLPTTVRIILFFALFLTTYLIIFLLFNLRQDPLIVIQNRLKRLQISLLEQFYDSKGEADWARWIRELENRREEIRALLKRGVRMNSDINSGEMDILINRSWDELLLMLGRKRETGIDEEKIAPVLTEEIEVLEELDDHDIESETAGDKLVNEGLEIVSPFSAMVFDTSPERSSADKNKDDELGINTDTDVSEGLPLITTPFSGILCSAVIETLESFNAGEEKQIDDDSIIREREGIHYVSKDVLVPSPEFAATLNRGFKELVDEVMK